MSEAHRSLSSGSLLEETVDMSGFADCLADTHEVLRFLKGKVTNPVAEGAETYLEQVDQGWSFKSKRVTKRTTVYLDQLSVVYIHHVGLLDTLTSEIKNVYVHEEVESHFDAVVRGAEASTDLLAAVERIRAALNTAIEKGSGIGFTARRQPPGTSSDDDEPDDFAAKLPSVDIMSDLSEVDAVICDDRYLIHEGRWSDGTKSAPCATTLDLLQALNSRGHLSETQVRENYHRLRSAGYHPVPFNAES